MRTFQQCVHNWMGHCFGFKSANDVVERRARFLEEALELVQATGMTQQDVLILVNYTFNRPVGDVRQEIGGVEVTLAGLCNAVGIDKDEAGQDELYRCWSKLDAIRAKQAGKPLTGPLPQ